jgi:hypothetical protein
MTPANYPSWTHVRSAEAKSARSQGWSRNQNLSYDPWPPFSGNVATSTQTARQVSEPGSTSHISRRHWTKLPCWKWSQREGDRWFQRAGNTRHKVHCFSGHDVGACQRSSTSQQKKWHLFDALVFHSSLAPGKAVYPRKEVEYAELAVPGVRASSSMHWRSSRYWIKTGTVNVLVISPIQSYDWEAKATVLDLCRRWCTTARRSWVMSKTCQPWIQGSSHSKVWAPLPKLTVKEASKKAMTSLSSRIGKAPMHGQGPSSVATTTLIGGHDRTSLSPKCQGGPTAKGDGQPATQQDIYILAPLLIPTTRKFSSI